MVNKERLGNAFGTLAPECDSKGGIYLVASMVEHLDEFLASMEHLQDSLEAKGKEIENLNGMIATLKADNEKALNDAQAQAEAAANDVEAKHQEALDAAAAEVEEKDNQLAAKDEEIKKLQEAMAEKDNIIAAKDAEINELSQTAQQAPTPQNAPQNNATGTHTEETFKVESVCKPGMTTKEKQAALKERMELLKKMR